MLSKRERENDRLPVIERVRESERAIERQKVKSTVT